MITYRFPQKRVLVTGSSRGIGATILEGFLKAEAIGFLHYFDDPAGENKRDALKFQNDWQQKGVRVELFPADIRDYNAVSEMMAKIKEIAGGIDILVNNAGILKDRSIRKMTLEDWQSVLDTNLTGVFQCCKLALDLLSDQGRIINIASIAGISPFHGQSNYAASKAGVIALTKVLAKELARRGITVNAIAPGVVQTTMLGELKPDVMAEYLEQIPMNRLAQPGDIANAVLFLASEESSYITGQVLPVTGGWLI